MFTYQNNFEASFGAIVDCDFVCSVTRTIDIIQGNTYLCRGGCHRCIHVNESITCVGQSSVQRYVGVR